MLGILIPTKNRSEFIIRQLHYYANVQCPYTIYIGDASNQEHIEKILSTIKKLKDSIKVVYKHYPELDVPNCLKEMARVTKEEYVAFVGDDDFLVPNSLGKCVTFLENNPEYRTAQGKGMIFSLTSNGSDGQDLIVDPYRIGDAQGEMPTQRLTEFLSHNWATIFAVHRTKEFYEDYENIELLTNLQFTEIMADCMSIIRGKSQQLDCFYLVRQHHDQRTRLQNTFGWITNPTWQDSFQIFYNTVTEALMKAEGINRETAAEIVKLNFEGYVMNGYIKRLNRELGKRTILSSALSFAINISRKIPGLKRAYHHIRNKSPTSQNIMQLDLLLSPSSPYHKDFMPIYNAVTNANKELSDNRKTAANRSKT